MPFFAPGFVAQIGTILKSNNAPTGNGTWYKCDGSVLSQSLYPGLFSLIGHCYMNFAVAENLAVASALYNIIWTGTRFLAFVTGAVNTYTSPDGVTWTAGTNLAAAVTNPAAVTDGAGNIIVYYPHNSTNSEVSHDGGATWATVVLPHVFSSIVWNGHNFVAVDNTVVNSYYSATGAAWTSNGAVLPLITRSELCFDGVALIFKGTQEITASNRVIYKSTDALGSVWAQVTVPQGGYGHVMGINPNNNTICISSSAAVSPLFPLNQIVGITKDQFGTVQRANLDSPMYYSSGTNPQYIWNGYCFIQLNGNNSLYTSVNGLEWHLSLFTNNFENPMNPLGIVAPSSTSSTDTYFMTSSQAADPVSGKFATSFNANGLNGSWGFTPNCNPATQFCLPYFSTRTWIRVS